MSTQILAVVRSQYAEQASIVCEDLDDVAYAGGFMLEPQNGGVAIIQTNNQRLFIWHDAVGRVTEPTFVKPTKALAQAMRITTSERKAKQGRFLMIRRTHGQTIASIHRGPYLRSGEPRSGAPITPDLLDLQQTITSERLDTYVSGFPDWRRILPHTLMEAPGAPPVSASDASTLGHIVPDTVPSPALRLVRLMNHPLILVNVPDYPEFFGLIAPKDAPPIEPGLPAYLRARQLTEAKR